jgi:hypothetical protein
VSGVIGAGSWTQAFSRTSARELKTMRRVAREAWPRRPISLLTTLRDPHEAWIRATFESLRRQVYPTWEWCVCDNGSTLPHVTSSLRALRGGRRLKVRTAPEPVGETAGLARALEASTGEFCAVIGCGDTLAPDALFRVIELMAVSGADVVYTDENSIDEAGEVSAPILKPSWSPELLLSTNYVGRLCVIRRSAIDAAGGIGRDQDEGSEHDLLLRVTECAKDVRHLPGILYHRRRLPHGADASARSPEAAQAALARRGEDASVRSNGAGSLLIRHRASYVSTVTALVRLPAGRTRARLLDELTRCRRVDEVIVVGGSPESARGLEAVRGPSPARAANLAVSKATSDYLLFCDGEGRLAKGSGDAWIDELLAHAERPGVGAVGCRLLYRDGRLRQGGRSIDLDALSLRPSERMPDAGRASEWDDRPCNPAIVRADCMMIARKRFAAVDGFEATRLPRSLYDVDLALRLRERGLRNVYTPDLTFVCGFAREAPPADEIAYLWERWWEELVGALSDQHEPARLARRDSAGFAIPMTVSSAAMTTAGREVPCAS